MRSTMLKLLPLLSLELLPSVAAHGYVSNVAIDGTSYKGNVPNQTPSALHLIPRSYNQPSVTDADSTQATAQFG